MDLLRRTKVALKEEGTFDENLALIQRNFEGSYGADGDEVFASLLRESGYDSASISMKSRPKL